MTGWTLGRTRFAEEVFLPFRDGWDPATDLFRCHQLDPAVSDPELIRRALDAVRGHLNASLLGGPHRAVAGSIGTALEVASEILLDPERRAAHRASVEAARADLVVAAAREADGAAEVPPQAVAAVRARFGSRFLPREVEEAFGTAGVALRVPADLPEPARPGGWDDIRLALRALGLPSLAAFVCEADRGLGPLPTAELVARRSAAIQALLSGQRLVDEERVLTAMARWARTGVLADVLRYDLVEWIATLADPAAQAAALASESIREHLRALDLPEPADVGYAVHCRVRYPPAAVSGWRSELDVALAARDLAAAVAVLAALSHPSPEDVEQRDRLVATLRAQEQRVAAAAAMEATDPDGAAAEYLAILASWADPAAEAGLRRCRPAPPPGATALVDGDRVRLRWSAAPVRAGEITYRVVRRTAAGDAVVASGTSELSYLDDAAPPGTSITYEVVTLRDGVPSATGAFTDPVVVLVAVTALKLVPGDGIVELQWNLPAQASGVRVRRTEETAPDSGTTTEHGGTERCDTGLRNGTAYTYGVAARYGNGATAAYSAETVARVVPQEVPEPVLDLRTEAVDGGVRLSWTPPPTGDVTVLLGTDGAGESGTVLPRTDLAGLGEAQPVPAEPGRLHVAVPTGRSVHRFVPVTVEGELAVVGKAAEYDGRLPAVGDPRVELRGAEALLTFVWPADVVEVRVYRRRGAPVESPDASGVLSERLTETGYRTGRGRWRYPSGEWHVAVASVSGHGAAEQRGPLARAAPVVVPRELAYRIEKRGWLGDRLVLVVTSTDGALPAVQLRGRIRFPPLRPDQGVEIVTAPASAAASTRTEFRIQEPGRPMHLRAFAVDADDVLLIPEAPGGLTIEGRR